MQLCQQGPKRLYVIKNDRNKLMIRGHIIIVHIQTRQIVFRDLGGRMSHHFPDLVS